MTETITLSNLWWNKGLANFCLRQQAQDKLEELVTIVGGRKSEDAFNQLEDAIEMCYVTVEDFEESLYSDSIDDILEYLGYGDVDDDGSI